MEQRSWFYRSYRMRLNYSSIIDWLDNSHLMEEETDNPHLVKAETDIYEKAFDMLGDLLETEYFNHLVMTKHVDPNFIISSKEHCMKWIEENKDFIEHIELDSLLEFWQKYPAGCIMFKNTI